MKKENPLFSIITISFNSVKTIEKTILSILNQTYKNIEYIVIDGGSTDGTIDIIKKYSDKIAYWVSEKDEGISDAYNKGILASHGEIIGIMNSDDWYELNALKIIAELDFENNADFYVGSLRYWDEKGNNIVVFPDRKYTKKISYRMPHLNHPSSFLKKEVYNTVGLFNKKYRYSLDYDLFLRISLNNKKCVFTNEVLSNMLVGGVSNIHEMEGHREVLAISKNKILGTVWYLFVSLKTKIRKIILACGGSHLLFLIKHAMYHASTEKNN